MIKIITDSTSYIPEELRGKYDITIIPHTVTIDGQEYLETEITNYSFYKKIDGTKELPKSTPPKQETILAEFEKEVEAGNTVIGVFISALASETIKRANVARNIVIKKHPKANITIVDSKNTCMALGIVALAAAEKHAEGAWLEDVVDAANGAVLRNRFLFIPKSLDQMAKTGKIGKAKALFGNLFQLIPLLTTINGEIAPFETVRTRKNALDRMVEIMKKDIETYGVNKVVVTHIDDPDDANVLIKKINEVVDIEVGMSEIGPSVGVSIGPGTIGLIYNTVDVHPMNV